jgi:hypothetical protein
MSDVKVIGGNNRQCDLLAFNLITQEQFHIESSVTHRLNWSPTHDKLRDIFDKKFRGIPPKREGEKTDHAKGINYFNKILQTYKSIGFDPSKIQRIFVTWVLKEDPQNFLDNYAAEHGIQIQICLFRDEILPELMKQISTSNYEDEVLRTLSLLREHDLQTK